MGQQVSQIFILQFKCAKCGEVWKVVTSPPKPEPASCCPRCASFVREFAGLEEFQEPAESPSLPDRRKPSPREIGASVQGRSSPPPRDTFH